MAIVICASRHVPTRGEFMGTEIERKFLVKNATWQEGALGTSFRQGYICTDPRRTVRVRLANQRGLLTIKGETKGLTRQEFEYAIPVGDVENLLALCDGALIEKTRYVINYAGKQWEVDEFHGENKGLVVAELELMSEDEAVEMPPWVGTEVSHDARYYNANLATMPYSQWS